MCTCVHTDTIFIISGVVCVCSEHGVSRSPTVVVAYLMWRECVSLQVAMAAVTDKKPDIR